MEAEIPPGAGIGTRTRTLVTQEPKSCVSTNSTIPANTSPGSHPTAAPGDFLN